MENLGKSKRECIVKLTKQVVGGCETCHHDADHGHQFDEDVQRRTRSVLEWVTHGVAYDCRLMVVRAFATEVAFFNILLGIVPSTTGICHEDGEHETGRKTTNQQT